MSPDEVWSKPRFVRVFLLKSMELQLEGEAEQAAAMKARQQAMAASRRRR